MGCGLSELIHLLEGHVVLYKRERSSVWQCRYKLGDLRWRRTSTGAKDVKEAGKAALRIFYEGEVKRENKLPLDSRRFGSVADAVVNQMQDELAAGIGKSVFHSYIFAINGYLKPYFGKHGIDKITPALLHKFGIPPNQ